MKSALAYLTLVLSISVGVAACDARHSESDPDGAARARTGIVFDPSRARPGGSIAGLVVERVNVSRAMADSTFVGDIAFRGEIDLTGRTIIHPDADAADAACFEADSAGATKLPRWAEDRRRAWFCFSNGMEAIRALGPSREQRRARVVIADFVIHRGLSDQVNSARFVRLPEDSAATPSSDRNREAAAKEIVAFLRGDRPFGRILLADTVVLYLSPEGGGTRAAFTRENLRTPVNWSLRSGRHNYSFVPPRAFTTVTARNGRHFNCHEYSLASRYPDLAKMPHVGVKLEPDIPSGCLQSWNVTFVFGSVAGPPRLIAAVYDQWEW